MIKKLMILVVLLAGTFTLWGCELETVNPPYTIAEIAQSIEIGFADGNQANYVTENITLPLTSPLDQNATIIWFSIFSGIVSADGIVTRGDSDQNIVLTYTLTYYDELLTDNFLITVVGLNDSSIFKITFDSVGGSLVDDIIAYEGDEITEPDQPTKDGYEFAGWYTSDVYLRQFTFTMMPSGDLTLYAKWNYIDENTYTITFDSDGGSSVDPIAAKGGVAISEPTDPTKDGYIFVGWYIDQTLSTSFTFNYMPYESVVVYAKWMVESTASYTGYYEGVAGLTGSTLYNYLHTLVNTGFHGVTYGDARYMLDDTDRDPNNASNVILVYRATSVSGFWDGGTTWNREHVWPQSLLGVSADNNVVNSASDLQNLKPANPGENSSRGNKWYANSTTTYSYAPRDAVKGDIARILLYMDIMYSELTLVNLSQGQDPSVHQMGDLAILLAWNALDPVDAFELSRNEQIFGLQGNRNPFIDHPELVDYIWNL